MAVLYYARPGAAADEKLQRIIRGVLSGRTMEVCTSIEGLIGRLRRPRGDLRVVVFLIARYKELASLLHIREALEDLPLILVLPDSEKDALMWGFKLYPRLIVSDHDNLNDVAAVIQKKLISIDPEKKAAARA